jgi:imidazolonepropionase-like amidohydrolase
MMLGIRALPRIAPSLSEKGAGSTGPFSDGGHYGYHVPAEDRRAAFRKKYRCAHPPFFVRSAPRATASAADLRSADTAFASADSASLASSGNRASYVPTLWLVRFEEKTAEVRYANLKQVADAGVRVALGSDSFCGFGKFGENTIEEAERSAQAGIGAAQILRMATKDAAEHLGVNDLGVIAPGKLADLLLLDGDPTTSIGALRKLSIVIQNGAIVVDNAHIA